MSRSLAFWDIESLSNVFMFCIWAPANPLFTALFSDTDTPEDHLVFFSRLDGMTLTPQLQQSIRNRVLRTNSLKPDTRITFLDLGQRLPNELLLHLFCADDRPLFRRTENPEENGFYCISGAPHSDLDEDTTFPYLVGYNSSNYDCTMISNYINETWHRAPDRKSAGFQPPSAADMRAFNNRLFERKDDMRSVLQGEARNICDSMLRSGLMIDAAKLNTRALHLPLKRIMGLLGMGIVEDALVSGDAPAAPEQLPDLFAYNASDCIKLAKLFRHPAYAAQFELKRGLLESYPDIIWKTEPDGTRTLRAGRLKADDTSARFAQHVLCPDGCLTDLQAVNFEYPAGSGCNALQQVRDWAQANLGQFPEAMARLNPVFDWYASMEGKNANTSEACRSVWGRSVPDLDLTQIPAPCTCVPYFNADGTPSRTYVNFGIGGIHGAEYNLDLYRRDLKEWEQKRNLADWFFSHFSEEQLQSLKPTVTLDGEKYRRTDFLMKKKDGTLVRKYPKEPQLFVKSPQGVWGLNKKYVWCSDAEVDHEDFTSYYPGLLMNLKAYENPALGEDRYVQQFERKKLYGTCMKDPSRTEEERQFYATMRAGTKLILNSATGASDTKYDNPIRMNNRIITMRIIGQLFTWQIAQAQTLAGFRIVSTNTDGIYAACTPETRPLCRQILQRESASIRVPIEPEAMRLISKDANNRIEVSLEGEILSASGGDTACWAGPAPDRSLTHPALIDRLLTQYMIRWGVNAPFDLQKAVSILEELKRELPSEKLLLLCQHIVSSSESKTRYVYAVAAEGGEDPGSVDDNDLDALRDRIQILQQNSRIFAVRTPCATLHMANGWDRGSGHSPVADEVLYRYGADPSKYRCTRVISVSRVDPRQNICIINEDLSELPEDLRQALIQDLDEGWYMDLLESAYTNWCNIHDLIP